MIRVALVGAIVVLAAVGLWRHPAPEWRFVVPAGAALGTGPQFETVFEYTSPEGTAHAPAIVDQGGQFDILWFDGIRESHNDVRILKRPGVEDVTRQTLSARMVPLQTVLTLGNPLDAYDKRYVTAVSLGGWAASSVVAYDTRSARKLSLSPILNRSHLVKSPVVGASQGRMLPTYFEMGAAYGALALVDKSHRVRGQSVMTGGAKAIQPMIVPLSVTEGVALLRSFDRGMPFIMFSQTRDGGRTWSTPEPLDVPNPSAPVAAVRLEDGRILMLFNDDAQDADTLTFAVSEDGRTWTRTRVLDGPGTGDLRYPMMVVLQDGQIAVTYSTGFKAGIVAHIVTADWALNR